MSLLCFDGSNKLYIYHAGMCCGVSLPYLLLVLAFPGKRRERFKVTDYKLFSTMQDISIANHKSHHLHLQKWLADVLEVESECLNELLAKW